jgi:hypothetical protein
LYKINGNNMKERKNKEQRKKERKKESELKGKNREI